jgi:DNA end-binding protein Ku
LPKRGDVAGAPQHTQGAKRAFWSGTITFGLVSVPVDLLPGTKGRHTAMKMVDSKGRALGRRYYCPKDDKPLDNQEIVRGFRTEDGKTVVVTDEDLESVAPEITRDITLRAFVPKDRIPAAYYQRPYFLAPSGRSTRAYHLLAQTMERTGRVGIGSIVMRGHEYLVAILSDGNVLRAETLRYADELRTPGDIGLPRPVKAAKKRVRQIAKSIEALTRKELDMDELSDRYAEKIEAVAESKRKKGEDVVDAQALEPEDEEQAGGAEVIDLMKLLRRRLAANVGGAASDGGTAKPAKRRNRRAKQAAAKKSASSRESEDDLASLSKQDLLKLAQALDIAGRSTMAKAELVAAIRKAA